MPLLVGEIVVAVEDVIPTIFYTPRVPRENAEGAQSPANSNGAGQSFPPSEEFTMPEQGLEPLKTPIQIRNITKYILCIVRSKPDTKFPCLGRFCGLSGLRPGPGPLDFPTRKNAKHARRVRRGGISQFQTLWPYQGYVSLRGYNVCNRNVPSLLNALVNGRKFFALTVLRQKEGNRPPRI